MTLNLLVIHEFREWVDRLQESERKDFHEREAPPETEGEEQYCTSAAVILFQMVNQQINIAAEAARGGKLLLDVVTECFNIFKYNYRTR